MTENIENVMPDVNMDTSEINYDNLPIIREFNNIIDAVSDSMFIECVPQGKMQRVKWLPMFHYFKQNALEEMVEELNSMWKYENMQQKLQILEKQKEKFSNIDAKKSLWRPQLADVDSQLKAHDYANLLKQKSLLESLSRDYDNKINRLQKTLSAKRSYFKVLLMDIQKYEEKCVDVSKKIGERIEKHNQHMKIIAPSLSNIDLEYDLMDADNLIEEDRN